jgi:hypothetical protein
MVYQKRKGIKICNFVTAVLENIETLLESSMKLN